MSMGSPPPEEEEAAETKCDELFAPPFPIPLHYLWEGDREFGSKVKPRKKGQEVGRFFYDLF